MKLAPITITFSDAVSTANNESQRIQQIAQNEFSEFSLINRVRGFLAQEFYWADEQGGKIKYYRPTDKVSGYATYQVVCITCDVFKVEFANKEDGGHKLVKEVIDSMINGTVNGFQAIKLGQSVYKPKQPRVVKVASSNVENLWEEPLVKPLAELTLAGGAAKQFEDHILHNFQGSYDKQQWFLDWLAFQYQRPTDLLPHHCYLYHAEGGHGKGLLKTTLQQVFGMSAVIAIKNMQALGDASVQVDAVTRTMMVLEEYPSSSSQKMKNDIKTMAAAGTISAARKYEGMRLWQTTANFIFQSNHAPTMFDQQNDRRWFVAQWYSEYESVDAKDSHFGEYVTWLESGGGYEAISALLRDRDISHYNTAKKPLQTEELFKALKVTEDENITLVVDYLEANIDRPVFGVKELEALYKGTKLQGNLNAIKHNLSKVGLVRQQGQFNTGGGNKVSLYCRDGVEIVKQQPQSILTPSGDPLREWLAKLPTTTDF